MCCVCVGVVVGSVLVCSCVGVGVVLVLCCVNPIEPSDNITWCCKQCYSYEGTVFE